jgi:hypothetical protein
MKLTILMALDFAMLEPAGAGTFPVPRKVMMARTNYIQISKHDFTARRVDSI